MGLFAREMEVDLLELRAPNSIELLRLANAAVDESVRSARMYAINTPHEDCQYNRDTNHGMNAGAQTRWNACIAANMARRTAADFHMLMT